MFGTLPEDITEEEQPVCAEDMLLKSFHRAMFAQYECTGELIDQFDFLCSQWVDRLVAEKRSDNREHIDWLQQERFAWKLALHMCNDWNKARNNFKDEISGMEHELSRIRSFCDLLEADYVETAKSISSKYSYIFNQSCDWPETLFKAKKPRFDNQYPIRMDPDAPFTCCPLATGDQIVDDKILEVAFALLRCGKLDEAVTSFESIGQHWRAVVLLMALNELPVEESDLWLMTNAKLAYQGELSCYERAINGVIAGEIEPIWLVCHDLNDFWWAAAKCFLQKSASSVRGSTDHTTLNGVFNIVRDKAPVKVVRRARMPIRLVQQLLVLEEIEDVIEVLMSSLSDWLESDGFQFDLYRFIVHMAIVLRQCAPNKFVKHKYERIDAIILGFSKYICRFPSVSKLSIDYLSLVRDVHCKREGLLHVIETAPSVDDKLKVLQLATAVLGSDDVQYAVTGLMQNRRADMELKFDSVGLQMGDDEVRELELLVSLPGEVADHVLLHGNALCRVCMSIDDQHSLNELINIMDTYGAIQSTKFPALLDEHEDIVEYTTFQNAVSRWLSVSGCQGAMNNANCQTIANEVKKCAVRILKREWMAESPLKLTEDKHRNGQLATIRKNCLPQIFMTALAILEKCEMPTELSEIFRCFANVNSLILTLLSAEQLKTIARAFSDVCSQFACKGNDPFRN